MVKMNFPGWKVLKTFSMTSKYDVIGMLLSNETYENSGSGVMWMVMYWPWKQA